MMDPGKVYKAASSHGPPDTLIDYDRIHNLAIKAMSLYRVYHPGGEEEGKGQE